jgi:hypothetical protein
MWRHARLVVDPPRGARQPPTDDRGSTYDYGMSTDEVSATQDQEPEPSEHETEVPPEAAPATTSSGRDSDGAAPPKKRPTRSAKPSKTRRSRSATSKGKASTRGKGTGSAALKAAKYPRHPVERALRIPQAIYDQNGGKPATLLEAVAFTGGSAVSGNFRTEVSSSKKYGFLEGADKGKIALTDRARRAIAPQSDNDRLNSLREGILDAPDLSEVYNYYRGENLPDQTFFVNALTDRFGLPVNAVPEFLEIFNESMRSAQLIDEEGERPRLIDIGRDQEHRPKKADRVAREAASSGKTCFVMQPFAGHLGGYFESIYKPAIEQAGLQALRADAEIFGTGKIMDQIWRGIHAADILVAELTSKNPNVFYELGLAHALEKPVVLVSSNQEDVPFDLRHIRVILYDQTDPFWGQKLVNKLADNIQSALTNPEDAIFRVEQD